MIEHVSLYTREAVFHLAYSGKYSFLIGDSGTGKSYMTQLLLQIERGYKARVEGSRKLAGGDHGAALDHLEDENTLLVWGEDFDVPKLLKFWPLLEKSPNPMIFQTRDMLPGVPYTSENVFAMKRLQDREFAMVPYSVK